MKAFAFVGIGLYLENKWLALSMRVDEEIDIPKEIPFPEERGMTIKMSEKPGMGPNFVSGVIWCESIYEADECLKSFAKKAVKGELPDFGRKVDPLEIFANN